MRRWDIWADTVPGACLYVGAARGATFAEACLGRALRDRDFGEQFDPISLTLEGRTLHSTAASAARQPASGAVVEKRAACRYLC